ncbi:MAG TPA: NB-ARC domain-containing protein [Candidatus Acidoferrales bacterium]|nr:NB-ARC domain-containing protein [Candidatus Acidoferrales bacterium]
MRLGVRLFGQLRVTVDDRPVELTGTDSMLGLFAALVLARGAPVARAAVAERLWPEDAEGDVRHGLRQQIYYLNNAFRKLAPGAAVIAANKTSVGLDPSVALDLDLDAYEAGIRDGRDAEAAQLYATLLDEAWAHDDREIARERERLAALQAGILARLVSRALDDGALDDAVRYACELVRVDLEKQSLLVPIVRKANELLGRAGASRIARRLLGFLESLEDEPIPEVARACRAVLGALPAEPQTPFLGRDHDLRALHAAVDVHPCVTVAGPIGVGKTRLALRLAHELAPQFADGAWFVDLADAGDGQLLEPAILEALNPLAEVGEPSLAALLRGRRALLVLDACDGVARACGALVASIAQSGDGIKILATSRAPLGSASEEIFRVEPLSRQASLELFSARVPAARLNEEPRDASRKSAESICRQLEGFPLLLELAAARARTMSLNELARRLRGGLEVLPDRGVRSLEKACAWSYRLLDANEQRLFARAGVFPGSFEAADLAAVDGEAGEDEVRRALERLAEVSFLERTPADGGERYAMVRPLREFARQLLEERCETAVCSERFAARVYTFVAERAEALNGPSSHAAFREVTQRLPDVRAALRTLLDGENAPLGLSLALALTRYWFDRGGSREGAQWIRSALRAIGGDAYWRARALSALYTLTRNLGDFQASYEACAEALEAIRREGSPRWLVLGSLYAANALRMVARFDEARALAEDVRKPAAAEGEYLAAFVAGTIATVDFCQGRLAEARAGFEDALRRFRACEARGDAALAVANLGWCAYHEGEIDAADIYVQDALRVYRELGNPPYYTAHACELAARVAAQRRDPTSAWRFARELIGYVDRLGEIELAVVAAECVAALTAAGDPAAAVTLLAAGERLRARYHLPRFPVDAPAMQRVDAAVRAALSPQACEAARIVGEGLELDATLARARSIANAFGAAPKRHRA